MSKRTPGDWYLGTGTDEAIEDGEPIRIYAGPDEDTLICEVSRDDVDAKTQLANAQHIARACSCFDEMLAALRKILAHECQGTPCMKCASIARAAIKKATADHQE